MGLFGLPSFDTLPSVIRPLWAYGLQSGSFDGCDFNLTDTEPTDGRKIALHEYPYSDEPWAEDLGRANQIIPIRGYLVGDDVLTQRDALKASCAKQGSHTLIHPSLGSMDATCLSSSFAERAENGRVVGISLVFVISRDPYFPSAVTDDSQNASISAANNVSANATTSFLSKASAFIKSGIATVAPIVNVVTAFGGLAASVAGLATHPLASTKGVGAALPSTASTGRYQGNLSAPNPALAGLTSSNNSTANLLAATRAALANATTSRSAVNSSVATATSTGSAL